MEDTSEEPEFEQSVIKVGGLIEAHLRFGNYTAAKTVLEDLQWIMKGFQHDEMVALVNSIDITTKSARWIVQAWSKANGIKYSEIEFETAVCIATCGETLCYREGKKTWGNLVRIIKDDFAAIRAAQPDEGAKRMKFVLKENNPIRLKQTTRNELKIVLGSAVVAFGMRSKKDDFIASLSIHERCRVERVTGLSIGRVWAAIRNGSKDLIDRLGAIPSTKRVQMQKNGMFTADHVPPQLSLF